MEETRERDIQPWTRIVNPTFQPQSSMIKMKQSEKRFRRANLERRIKPLLVVGALGLGLYLSCNEPKGKPLEGFDQSTYNQTIIASQY
ncbi:hypothetical protein HYT57_00940 [Candidatus Woesearchaeota archaeon]|nr:hypothetical protein [Candidatus Woesearchaeota archaeon]